MPLGMTVRRVVVPEDLWHVPRGPALGARINLIADSIAADLPICSLYFHVDTVCAANGWTREPLRLTQENDRLYGLGAADMKGAIAAAIHALRVARDLGLGVLRAPCIQK